MLCAVAGLFPVTGSSGFIGVIAHGRPAGNDFTPAFRTLEEYTRAGANPLARRLLIMKRPIVFCLLALLACCAAFGADQTPELARLNHYVGEWDGTLSSMPGAIIRISCEWISGGAVLRHTQTIQPPNGAAPVKIVQLMSYDVAKRNYRVQSFYPDDSFATGEGVWDAASGTFTWTTRDEVRGTTVVTRVSFPDADSEVTATQIKDRGGEVMGEIRGTKKRRK